MIERLRQHPTHRIDLARIARHRAEQHLFAAIDRIVARRARCEAVDRGGQVAQETPRDGKGFGLARHLLVDHAVAAMDFRAAQLLLVDRLADRGSDRRAGGKQLRQALDHHRIMARHRARRAEPRRRAKRERHDGNGVQIGDDMLPAGHHRHIGVAHRLERLDRSASAGAVDHADERQAQFVRHRLALDKLAVQSRIGRPAAHGEIVGAGDDRAAVDIAATEDEIGRRQIDQIAVLIVAAAPGDLADLAKAARIEQRVDPCARIHLAARMLPRNLVFPTHLLGQRTAPGELVDLFLPTHAATLARGVASVTQENQPFFLAMDWTAPSVSLTWSR